MKAMRYKNYLKSSLSGGIIPKLSYFLTIFSNKLVIHLCRKKNCCGFIVSVALHLHGKPKSLYFIP